jgi:hypothetical protein
MQLLLKYKKKQINFEIIFFCIIRDDFVVDEDDDEIKSSS